MRKKNQFVVQMVNCEQIATRRYPHCTTPRAVQAFCTKFRVPRFWWSPPQANQKLLMVDYLNFCQRWNDVYGQPTTTTKKTSPTKTTSFSSGGTRSTTKSTKTQGQKSNWKSSTTKKRRTY